MSISNARPPSLIAEVEAVVDVATVSVSVDPTFDVGRSYVFVVAGRVVVGVQERDRIVVVDVDEIRSVSWALKRRERRGVVFVVRITVEVKTVVVISIFIVLEKEPFMFKSGFLKGYILELLRETNVLKIDFMISENNSDYTRLTAKCLKYVWLNIQVHFDSKQYFEDQISS